jgi:hypothetical protein
MSSDIQSWVVLSIIIIIVVVILFVPQARAAFQDANDMPNQDMHSLLLIRPQTLPEWLPSIDYLLEFSSSLSQVVGPFTEELEQVYIALPHMFAQNCQSLLPGL